VCAHIVKADFIERSLFRAELLQGTTIENLILDEVCDLQRDLLRVVDPRRDEHISNDTIQIDVNCADEEPRPATVDYEVPGRVKYDVKMVMPTITTNFKANIS